MILTRWAALVFISTTAFVLVACTAPQPRTTIKSRYQVFTTGQFDREKEPVTALSLDVVTAAGGHAGDVFAGTARAAAKTSIASANTEQFANIRALRHTLESDNHMRSLNPPISEASTSNRINVEERNVQVETFIYAIKKEDDHDFHVIVGDEGCHRGSCFLNVEISGWPRDTHHPDRPALKSVRSTFIDFFGEEEPGVTSGYDKFNPPIPVRLTGSLFFDVDHKGGTIGPSCCRPTTAWEIHPVSDVVFEP